MKDDIKTLKVEMTSNGKRPQNILSWISQQPLIGSSSTLKHKLRGENQNQKCLKWRRPLTMGGDLEVKWNISASTGWTSPKF